MVPDDIDDDRLLAALREALEARRAVPDELIQASEGAYTWLNIDTELAQLTYDSSTDRSDALVLRAETASIRSLTFTSPHLTIELEVTGSALLGQIIPVQPGTIEVQDRSGEHQTVAIDDLGCFSISPIPAGQFRMRSRAADGLDVATGWITL
jgi:hypothetical protein